MTIITLEHNTAEHMHIIEQHTADKGCLFSDFRAPDIISTFTWGGAQAIEALFNPQKISAHNLVLVHNDVLPQLIDDIQKTLTKFSPQQGQHIGWSDTYTAGVCVAVWNGPKTHSLVAVASNLRHFWHSDHCPPIEILALGERWLHNKGILDSLEYILIDGEHLPVGVFDALGETAISGDQKVRVEQMIEEWLNSTDLVWREDSLLLKEFEVWVAHTQKQVLEQHIDPVAIVRKRVL